MVLNECIDDGDDVMQCIDCDRNQYVREQLTCYQNKKNYSFFHLNIRSPRKHHDDLVTLLTNTGCSFDVTGCSETWLNDGSYADILNRDGYISSTHHVSVCDDIVIAHNRSDSLFVEIPTKNGKNDLSSS